GRPSPGGAAGRSAHPARRCCPSTLRAASSSPPRCAHPRPKCPHDARERIPMKVTNVQIHVVNVPFLEPETWTFGRSWGLTSGIVEVSTDDGIVGLGELPGAPTIDTAGAGAPRAGRPRLRREHPRGDHLPPTSP